MLCVGIGFGVKTKGAQVHHRSKRFNHCTNK